MTVLPGQNIMESLNGDFERDGKVTNYIATGWELNNYLGYFDAYVVDEDKHSGDYSLKCTLDEKAYHNKAGTQFTQGGVSPSMDFTNLPAGTYTFRAWIRSNVKFKIGVKTQKQTVSYIPWYEYTDDEWHELVIENIKVIDGTLQIDTWFDRSAQPDSIKLDEDLVLYAYLDDILITLNDENAIQNGDADKGILVCGTGIGMSIAANKHKGIRAAVCSEHFSTRYTRLHNDTNVLCLGARVIGSGIACELVDIFLSTSFEGGRHKTRVDKITEIENI
jgi:hypothetical protein